MVECLTRDRRAAGSSLTGVTALWSLNKTHYPSLVLVQPRKTRPYITERLLIGRKETNQTNQISKRVEYSKDAMRQSACLVVNTLTVCSYCYLCVCVRNLHVLVLSFDRHYSKFHWIWCTKELLTASGPCYKS